MDRRGQLQVSPEALRHEAGVLAAIPHPGGYGAELGLLALADAVAGDESNAAAARFGHRLTSALSVLDQQRGALARSLGRAAAAYAELETRVERGMRPGS